MSGGSFGYAFTKTAEDVIRSGSFLKDLEGIKNILEKDGFENVLKHIEKLEKILQNIQSQCDMFDTCMEEISDVLKAVEYREDGDYSETTYRNVVENFIDISGGMDLEVFDDA